LAMFIEVDEKIDVIAILTAIAKGSFSKAK
jgi:hypothetical protein